MYESISTNYKKKLNEVILLLLDRYKDTKRLFKKFIKQLSGNISDIYNLLLYIFQTKDEQLYTLVYETYKSTASNLELSILIRDILQVKTRLITYDWVILQYIQLNIHDLDSVNNDVLRSIFRNLITHIDLKHIPANTTIINYIKNKLNGIQSYKERLYLIIPIVIGYHSATETHFRQIKHTLQSEVIKIFKETINTNEIEDILIGVISNTYYYTIEDVLYILFTKVLEGQSELVDKLIHHIQNMSSPTFVPMKFLDMKKANPTKSLASLDESDYEYEKK